MTLGLIYFDQFRSIYPETLYATGQYFNVAYQQ